MRLGTRHQRAVRRVGAAAEQDQVERPGLVRPCHRVDQRLEVLLRYQPPHRQHERVGSGSRERMRARRRGAGADTVEIDAVLDHHCLTAGVRPRQPRVAEQMCRDEHDPVGIAEQRRDLNIVADPRRHALAAAPARMIDVVREAIDAAQPGQALERREE